MIKYFSFIFFFSTLLVHAQVPIEGMRNFNRDVLRKNIEMIAGPEFAGRGVGQGGYLKAAEYIAKELNYYGIRPVEAQEKLNIKTPGYFQMVPMIQDKIVSGSFKIGAKSIAISTDCLPLKINKGSQFVNQKWVFMGYGIQDDQYSDFKSIDASSLKNKGVVILDGEPLDKDNNFLISKSNKASKWSRLQTKIDLFAKLGVTSLIIISDNEVLRNNLWKRIQEPKVKIDPDFAAQFQIEKNEMTEKEKTESNVDQSMVQTPWVFVCSFNGGKSLLPAFNWKKIKSIIDSKKSSFNIEKESSLVFDVVQETKHFEEPNVMGYIRGKTPNTVLITAHLDHLGKHDGEIYYGADDDGSGSASILMMAQNFAELSRQGKLQNSVLFVWFTGEESGLLGSEFFSNHSFVPTRDIMCDLNVDMIGRNDEAHKNAKEYLYLIGADRISTRLHETSEMVNQRCCRLNLDYTYNDEKDPNRYYYRSDHYNFAEKGIPVIFYFKGIHEDYHKPTDVVSKIEIDTYFQASRLIYETAYELVQNVKSLPKK